ncbi:hypothetical protein M513_12176 [Trichuris suis]|uniref:Uncharacterized protein n=1 Tax=Trichuris suis TaxID=68888 RepID=A0A085LPN4_9BILA|nr:hypothetical protein M513_12176 [Trichuris suis]
MLQMMIFFGYSHAEECLILIGIVLPVPSACVQSFFCSSPYTTDQRRYFDSSGITAVGVVIQPLGHFSCGDERMDPRFAAV